jgi:DnaJ-class molecular chaperone
MAVCNFCDGTGFDPVDEDETCIECDGTGEFDYGDDEDEDDEDDEDGE